MGLGVRGPPAVQGDFMERIRYLYTLKMIVLALDEITHFWTVPADYHEFLDLVKQYGLRAEITDEEIEYVMNGSIKKAFYNE